MLSVESTWRMSIDDAWIYGGKWKIQFSFRDEMWLQRIKRYLHQCNVVDKSLSVVAWMLSTISCIYHLTLLYISENIVYTCKHFQSHQLIETMCSLHVNNVNQLIESNSQIILDDSRWERNSRGSHCHRRNSTVADVHLALDLEKEWALLSVEIDFDVQPIHQRFADHESLASMLAAARYQSLLSLPVRWASKIQISETSSALRNVWIQF